MSFLTPAQEQQLPDESPTAEGALEERSTQAGILQQLQKLSDVQREIVRLKFQSGLSYAEIAQVTGLSATNVGYHLHSAIKNLRKAKEGGLI